MDKLTKSNHYLRHDVETYAGQVQKLRRLAKLKEAHYFDKFYRTDIDDKLVNAKRHLWLSRGSSTRKSIPTVFGYPRTPFVHS